MNVLSGGSLFSSPHTRYLWLMADHYLRPQILKSGPDCSIPEFCHLAISDIRPQEQPDDQAELPPEDRRELSRMGSRNRRREFRSSRSLVRYLARHAGLDPATFRLRRTENGKPFGEAGGRTIHLSVSHTPRKVVCVLSREKELGIDMEFSGRKTVTGLRERILHAEERKLLAPCETLRIWTIKEAMLKLGGMGLRTNMKEVILTGARDHTYEGIFDNELKAKICSFSYENHWIALAYYG